MMYERGPKRTRSGAARRRPWHVGLLLVLALLASACGGDAQDDDNGAVTPSPTAGADGDDGDADGAAGEPIVIGVSAPLTGPGATFASELVAGTRTWAHYRNENGGIAGRPVELEICDDEGNPEGSTRCARDFLSAGIEAVLTYSFTGAVRAAHGVFEDQALVVNSSPNVVPEAGTTHFQSGATVAEIQHTLMEFAESNGLQRIGVLAATDASGEEAVRGFEEAATDFPDLELVVARIDPEDVEAGAQMSRLLDQGVDLIAISYSGGGAVAAARAYANLGADVPFVLNSANVTEAFVDLIEGFTPERLLGAPTVGTLDPEALDEPYRSRVIEFQEQYRALDLTDQENPDGLSMAGRYTGDIVAAAIEGGGPDAGPRAWADWLATGTVESLTDIRFDAPTSGNNVPVEGFMLRIVERVGDEWKVVEDL